MISTDNIRSGVGVIGNAISLGLFLSPLPTFIGIFKKKDTEDFSPIPYLATLLNCMLWVFYGIVVPHNTLVWTINGAGLVLETAYLFLFFWYAPNKSRVKVMKILAVELLFILGVVLGVMLGAHQAEKKKLIVGILCVIFGTIMYASPLAVMRMVIRTKSVEYMPFLLSLASFFNGICWTTYALLRFDLNIIIPNGLGTLFGLAQLILYACYKKTTPKKGSSLPAKTDQLELPTVNPAIVRQGSSK